MDAQADLFQVNEAAANVVAFPQSAAPRRPVGQLADYELLGELVGEVASKALLQRFGSLPAVIAGDAQEIARIAGAGRARRVFLAREAANRLARSEVSRRCVISSWSALLAYVRQALAHEGREQFRVLFLDKKNQLIADKTMGVGTIDHAPVYPREVVREALYLDASAIILVHNHPSGDPSPSGADIDMTRQVIDACRPLRLSVHDHLVVGRNGVASFKSLGLM